MDRRAAAVAERAVAASGAGEELVVGQHQQAAVRQGEPAAQRGHLDADALGELLQHLPQAVGLAVVVAQQVHGAAGVQRLPQALADDRLREEYARSLLD